MTKHAAAAVAAVAVAVGLLAPVDDLLDLGGGLGPWRWFDLGRSGTGSDKAVHFLVFLVLAVLAHRSLGELAPAFRRQPALSGLITLGYGWLLEGLQLLVPARSFEVADGVADALGVGLAVFALATVVRFRDRRNVP